MQTIPQETVYSGWTKQPCGPIGGSQSACPRHSPDSMPLLWMVLKASLTENLPSLKLHSTPISLPRGGGFFFEPSQHLCLNFLIVTFSPNLLPVINSLSKELCVIHLSVLYYALLYSRHSVTICTVNKIDRITCSLKNLLCSMEKWQKSKP